jgi:mannan endo-1,4-beta-mannosidase
VTVPALLFCCLYASGMLGTIAPKGWHPPEATQAEQAEHDKLAALAARTRLAAQDHKMRRRRSRELGMPLNSNRFFGVALPGNALQAWYQGTDIHPQLLMDFQSWGATKKRDRMPTHELKEDDTVGIHAEMFTWEPWRTPRLGSTVSNQERAQPKYSDKAIADGKWDTYITNWANDVKKFPTIKVYIRFAHEMNGSWYPWSLDPQEYVLAWRHVVDIFHQQKVRNARFVWSADFGEGPPSPAWQQNLMAYWPGRKYVSDIGTTMINFGGSDGHSVNQFTPRIDLVHQLLHMPVMLTEVNTAKQGRYHWMLDLANYVAHAPWISGVVLSQAPSYGANDMLTGNLHWHVSTDNSRRARQAFIDLVWSIFQPATPVHQHRVSTGA